MPLDSGGRLEIVDPDACRDLYDLWDLLNPDYDYGPDPFGIAANRAYFRFGRHLEDSENAGPELTFHLVTRLTMPHLIHTIEHLRDRLAMADAVLGASLEADPITVHVAPKPA